MAPKSKQDHWINAEKDVQIKNELSSEALLKEQIPSKDLRKWDIVWDISIILLTLHIGAVYGFYLFLTAAKWQTCVFTYLLYVATLTSVWAGAHRLWSHKAYKAKLPLRIILLTFFTMAFQESVLRWVRTHRTHHKNSDTDADPHNAERGFFFSHIGWTLIRRHPHVKAQIIDLSDLQKDPLIRYQDRYYWPLALLLCFLVPTNIPVLWVEKVWISFFVCACLRFIYTLHVTFLVNSVAHKWGIKPYDKHIRPVENKIVSFLALGEGFHNYHHTFPWDYKTAELGGYSLNLTKLFIDTMASIGWAYDLKTVSRELTETRVRRTGDGTHPVWG